MKRDSIAGNEKTVGGSHDESKQTNGKKSIFQPN